MTKKILALALVVGAFAAMACGSDSSGGTGGSGGGSSSTNCTINSGCVNGSCACKTASGDLDPSKPCCGDSTCTGKPLCETLCKVCQ